MQIFIKTLPGKMLTLDISKEQTVADLKKMIATKTGLPVKEQRVLFMGKPLNDDKTLQDYDVVKESTLFLVPLLPGGGDGFLREMSVQQGPIAIEMTETSLSLKEEVHELPSMCLCDT